MVAEVVTPAGTHAALDATDRALARVAAYGVPAESTTAADINTFSLSLLLSLPFIIEVGLI